MGRGLVLVGLCLGLAACTGMDEGSQAIPLATNPPGADCILVRGGRVIGRIAPTPGTVTLSRSADPLTYTCRKDGYYPASYVNDPIPQDVNFAQRMAVSLGQSDEGAGMLYHSPVTITLAPIPAPSKPAKPAKIPFGALQPAPSPVPTPKVESAPLPGAR